MKSNNMLKRLPAVIMLVCDCLMAIALYREFAVYIPKAKGIGSLYVPVLACLLLIAAFIFTLKKGKMRLFRMLSFVCLFFCNVFTYGGVPAQIVFVFALALDQCLEHIHIKQFTNLALVVVSFLICAGMASIMSSFIGRIKTPKMVTNIQETWFSLVEDVSNPEPAHEEVVDPEDTVKIPLGRLAGNVITNDYFDPDDPTMSMVMMSSCPVDKLMVFACYDYNPERHRFELAPQNMNEEDAADLYFQDAGAMDRIPEDWILIEDNSIYSDMRFVPYCDFVSTEGFDSFKDLYAYLGGDHPLTYRYYVNTGSYYKTSAPGYANYVLNNYLSVPSDFRYDLTQFLLDHEIEIYPEDRYAAVRKLCDVFDAEYIYVNEPPELPEGKDPVMWFIQESKIGYSKHFAAAEVLLLRAAGIPARYSYGYNFELTPGDTVVISEGDAYAYCEVFLDGAWQIVTELREAGPKPPEEEQEDQGTQTPDIPIPVDDGSETLEPESSDETFPWKLVLTIATSALAVLAAVLILKRIAKQYAPTPLQRINGSYLALKKFYFVRKDIMDRMLKVRYSKEGPEEDDAKILERETEAAKAQFKYSKKVWINFRFRRYLRRLKRKAVIQNLLYH
ncbi:MAG: transglutaminase domain-containing protein [Firmicutes bacterium]|nr:transglutaminase domain-containing protein [Bacillota bacterium]